MLKTYARIEDGVIVEYPVYEEHIKNRSHPFEWYTPVIYDEKPEAAIDQHTREILTIGNGVVNCSYVVENMSLRDLISIANSKSSPIGNSDKLLVSDIDPVIVQKVVDKVLEYSINKLETFVKSNGYDSIISAISYKDSTVAKYQNEANQVIVMRDNLWSILLTYSEEVKAGTKDFPVSVLDVDKIIPTFAFTLEATV